LKTFSLYCCPEKQMGLGMHKCGLEQSVSPPIHDSSKNPPPYTLSFFILKTVQHDPKQSPSLLNNSKTREFFTVVACVFFFLLLFLLFTYNISLCTQCTVKHLTFFFFPFFFRLWFFFSLCFFSFNEFFLFNLVC